MSINDWDEYSAWESDTFVSCAPITMDGWVFKISALEGRPMVFAANYYTEETHLIGFRDMVRVREWMSWLLESDGDGYYE
jgi:hypothetical protein|tara:strand:+ start:863 stop:1102 length:240 start_codon:yes stop_codon:yes gene_type:complete